jgi:hypothetical protein
MKNQVNLVLFFSISDLEQSSCFCASHEPIDFSDPPDQAPSISKTLLDFISRDSMLGEVLEVIA